MLMEALRKESNAIFLENFNPETNFERAVFFSWGCTIGDCGFCYMSAQPSDKNPRDTKRSNASILAEFILAKEFNWDIGFFTGGIGVLKPMEMEFLLRIIYEIIGEKIWLSVGPVPKVLLQKYLPYIKGVVGSTETINPELHKKVCPSKPLGPYVKMFNDAENLGLMKAMTFIVGMGESQDDFILLEKFILENSINKIHVYGLIPQIGTMFEGSDIPSKEEQGWWISKLRIAFPKLDIQAGIWEDRMEYISYLLKCGANSISKFKALKLFGTAKAYELEEQAKIAGRKFKGTMTKLADVDWDSKVDRLSVDDELKDQIKIKIGKYVEKIKKNMKKEVFQILKN